MTWFDYAVLVVLAVSALIGIWRGLVREIFALGGWIAAFLAAMLFADEAAALLPAGSATPFVRAVFAGAVIFVVADRVRHCRAAPCEGLPARRPGPGRPDARRGLRFRARRPHIIDRRARCRAHELAAGAVLARGDPERTARDGGRGAQALSARSAGGSGTLRPVR
jgi:hypothetical protein